MRQSALCALAALSLALTPNLAGAAADPAGSSTTTATAGPAAPSANQSAPVSTGTYTTAVKAEYVFGCMQTNGQTPDMLQRCSCSIDAIAAVLPYDTYETAETVLSMQGVPGQQAAMVRSVPSMKDAVEALRRAQADANQKCF